MNARQYCASFATMCAASLVLAMPVLAQPGSGPGAQQSDEPPSGYVCLARNGIGPTGKPLVTHVMIPETDEAWLVKRGFARSECATAESWMRTTGPSMCALADIQDAAFTAQFREAHGLTPAEICQLAGKLPAGTM